jgi:hypothetical protein
MNMKFYIIPNFMILLITPSFVLKFSPLLIRLNNGWNFLSHLMLLFVVYVLQCLRVLYHTLNFQFHGVNIVT